MRIKVIAVEYYDIDKDPDTGEMVTTFEQAKEIFNVDPGWFDWDEREIEAIVGVYE
jgi:hypothetical protein